VIATIILIAVTVAVSIAVAVWMGALTTGFMTTEQLRITSVTNTSNSATIWVSNSATSSSTVTQVWVGNPLAQQPSANLAFAGNFTSATLPATLPGNSNNGTITVTGQNFQSGNSYLFKLVTAKGNQYTYTLVAQ
jgi:FlaG/FlaF family flagellin (archaellin)